MSTSYAAMTATDAFFPNGALQHLSLASGALVQQYCPTTGVGDRRHHQYPEKTGH